jgi:ketosteroid isomerase-like protein
MSRENMEILRRADAAFQRGDLTAALADMDEDMTATRAAPLPDIKTYEGREGVRQMLLDWVEGFSDFAMSAEEFIDLNDRQVLVRIHQRAQGTQSGVPIEADFWFLYGFRNRKVVRLDVYLSKHQALEAVAGRSE